MTPVAAAVCLLLLLCVASRADAARTWTWSGVPGQFGPVALTGDGTLLSVWFSPWKSTGFDLQLAARAADGTWRSAATIGSATDDTRRLAVDGHGAAYVGWESNTTVALRRRAADGAFDDTVDPIGSPAQLCDMVVDQAGDLAVLVTEKAGTDNMRFYVVRRSAGDASFGMPQPVSGLLPYEQYPWGRLASSPTGALIATWLSDGLVSAASRPAGGPWTAPVIVSDPGSQAVRPSAAMDAAGNGVVAWAQDFDDRGTGHVAAATMQSSGQFNPPATLGLIDLTDSPAVASDDAGHALIAYSSMQITNGLLLVGPAVTDAVDLSTGQIAPPVDVSDGRRTTGTVAIAMSPGGRAAVVFDDGTLWIADRGGDGMFTPPEIVACRPPDHAPLAAFFDGAGETYAVWQRFSTAPGPDLAVSTDTPSATQSPASCPLKVLGITPNPATPGTTVTFDATSLTEPGARALEYEWDFDDDGVIDLRSADPTATHAYPAVGSFPGWLYMVGPTSGDRAGYGFTVNVATGSGPPGGGGSSGGGGTSDGGGSSGGSSSASGLASGGASLGSPFSEPSLAPTTVPDTTTPLPAVEPTAPTRLDVSMAVPRRLLGLHRHGVTVRLLSTTTGPIDLRLSLVRPHHETIAISRRTVTARSGTPRTVHLPVSRRSLGRTRRGRLVLRATSATGTVQRAASLPGR